MKLVCVRQYKSAVLAAQPGDVLEVPQELGEWLLRDGALCFEEPAPPEPPKRALRKPPRDKAITEATEK